MSSVKNVGLLSRAIDLLSKNEPFYQEKGPLVKNNDLLSKVTAVSVSKGPFQTVTTSTLFNPYPPHPNSKKQTTFFILKFSQLL